MFISSSVNAESILGSAKCVALLAIIAWCTAMLHFNMVSHVCGVLTCVVAYTALPQPRGVLPHFVIYNTII